MNGFPSWRPSWMPALFGMHWFFFKCSFLFKKTKQTHMRVPIISTVTSNTLILFLWKICKMISPCPNREVVYGRTELQGPVFQAASRGQSCILHCSRSGGLSRISQLRSVNLSPLGSWQATNLVRVPPPHGLVHWKKAEDTDHTSNYWAHLYNSSSSSVIQQS